MPFATKKDSMLQLCVDSHMPDAVALLKPNSTLRLQECTAGSNRSCTSIELGTSRASLTGSQKLLIQLMSRNVLLFGTLFGQKWATETFMRPVEIVPSRVKWLFASVYLVDKILLSGSYEDDIKHIRKVLNLLPDTEDSSKMQTWNVLTREVKCERHIIEPG